MSEFKIEKNVPIPAGRNTKYPFPAMEVGDSFVLPDGGKANSCRYAASHYGQRNGGKRFSIRKTGDGSYRCWRIK